MSRFSAFGGLAVGAAMVVSLLAGCSAEQSPSPVASPESGEVGATPESGELEAIVQQLRGDMTDDSARAQADDMENAVAACMNDQGFEYTPTLVSVGAAIADDDEVEWGTRAFATAYGYGITTRPVESSQSEDDAAGSDPNAANVAALTESERAAYDEALWGPAASDADASAAYDWEKGGCRGAAQHAVVGVAVWQDPEFTTITDALVDISVRAESTPEVVAAVALWSSCLADAGYPGFTQTDQPAESVLDRVDPGAPIPLDDSGAVTFPSNTASHEEEAANRSYEIALATADFDCVESSGLSATVTSAENRLQQEFVDENREQLDSLIARYGSK